MFVWVFDEHKKNGIFATGKHMIIAHQMLISQRVVMRNGIVNFLLLNKKIGFFS